MTGCGNYRHEQHWLKILCCSCCFYFVSLLIHVFSCLSPLAPFLFRFIQYITLSLNLSHPHLYLFVHYYRSIFTRSVSAPIIAHPLIFTTLLSAHLLIVSRFGLPTRGSLPNGHPPLHLVVLVFFFLQPFVYRSPALIIAHRTRVVNPQLATRRTLLTAFRFNHAPPQPAHHCPLSVYPPLLSSSSLVGPLPCSSSTLPHINTNIHPSKQTPSCIHHVHCTFTAFSNSSFFIHCHPASLWGYPTQSRSHSPFKPPHLHPQYSFHAHP